MAAPGTTYSTFARLSGFNDAHSDSEAEGEELVRRSIEIPDKVVEEGRGIRSTRRVIQAATAMLFLATLSVLALSASQAFPDTSFSHVVNMISFGVATSSSIKESSGSSNDAANGINGVTSVNTYSTDTSVGLNTNSGDEEEEEENDGDFLSGMLDGDDVPTIESETSTLKWSITRSGYSPIILDSDMLRYKIFDEVDTIIEPYATNGLFVTGLTDDSLYRYQICPEEQGSDCFYGVLSLNMMMVEEVDIECEPYDLMTVTIKSYSSKTGEEEGNYEGTAMCMYVRREIRGLSDEDLTATLDSMYALWSTEEEEGQELYGDDFHSASYLLKIHHFNAAWQDSDHIHEGNGFLAQHMKMTNIFEKSIQAVDPSVALPYWDFTIDSSQGLTAFQSVIMTEDTFGSMTMPYNVSWGFTYESDNMTDGAIPDGRWAYLKSPTNDEYPDLLAGFGYMRAPWNMNPSPYLSRFAYDYKVGISLPTCANHYAILNEDKLSSFMYDMQNDPHATTHSLSGGIYGCDLLTPMLEAGYLENEEQQKALCAKWVFYLKEFYRYGYMTPKTDCAVENGVQSSVCGFDCATDTKVLNAFMTNLQTKLSTYVPADMGVDGWYGWYDFVCTGDGGKIFSGDHLESASPHDPSFWVIHPTLERLYHAKMMAGGFKDSSWPADSVNDFVCDKAQCYDETLLAVTYGNDCCYGHYENDQFLDFLSGNRSSHMGDTNGEIIKAADPTSATYSMTYIYDTFTWNHCDDDLTSLLGTLSEEMDSYQLSSSKNLWLETQPTHAPTNRVTLKPTSSVTATSTGHGKPTKLPTASPERKHDDDGNDKGGKGKDKDKSQSKKNKSSKRGKGKSKGK